MQTVPVRVDGRFRLKGVLGSGAYGVVYRAQNIINDDVAAVKLEPVTDHSSSVEREYYILKKLKGGVGIPRALWFGIESAYHVLVLDLLGPSLQDLFIAHNRKFSLHTIVDLGDQLLSRLEYIHSHGFIHGDIKPHNVLMGLGNLRQTAFIIDFGIAKQYWNTAAGTHIPFRRGRRVTGTPAFASINSHLGLELGRRDDLESLTYMLIYFLRGSLPWLTGDHEKLSTVSILELKADTSIECLSRGLPSEIANMLIYSRSLAFSEEPDYDFIHALLCDLRATVPTSAVDSLDFTYPGEAIIHTHTCPNDPSVTPCLPEAISQPDLIHCLQRSNNHSVAEVAHCTKAPLRRSPRHILRLQN